MNQTPKRPSAPVMGMTLEQARAQQEHHRQMEAQQRIQQEILSAKDYDPESADFVVRPINDQVIFRRVAAAPVSATIVAPDSVAEQFMTWEVLAVGEGHLVLDGRRIPLLVSPGDHVVVSGQLVTQMHLGKTIWVGTEKQILFVIESKNRSEN